MVQSKKSPLTFKDAKLKAADYCAYQERTQQQVRDKLYGYGLRQDEVEEALADLITDGFINEQRYAIAYAGGKFRMKKWGKIKIINGLKAAKISDRCIDKALQEIDETDYLSTLNALLDKKKDAIKERNTFIASKKIASYAIQKGYEPDLVWDLVRQKLT